MTTTPSPDPWQRLRQYTSARIGLGHVGTSLPTAPLLAFQHAHAQARDAVHLALDTKPLRVLCAQYAWPMLSVHSLAESRAIYLQRPDYGRRLCPEDRNRLIAQAHEPCDIAVVVADGLSSLAIHHHAPAMLERLHALAEQAQWTLSPVVAVHQGRVAIADEIGECLQARLVVILIGERPGLSSPDSLGIYLTYAPHVGCSDAQRNCISNIRPEGLAYPAASATLAYLLREALQRQCTGIHLKDDTDLAPLAPSSAFAQMLRVL